MGYFRFLLCLLVLLLSGGVLQVQAKGTDSPEQWVEQARVLIEKGELEAAERLYIKAAKGGSAEIRYQLGLAYMEGAFDSGFPDTDKAVKWVKKAAKADHPGAQFQMGLFYMTGYGNATRSPRVASKWLIKAADQGNAQAAKVMGFMFARGESVKEDPVKAREYLRLAADAGDVESTRLLSQMSFEGQGGPVDPAEGVRLLSSLAEAGDVQSQGELGAILATGSGIEPDLAAARQWWQMAAEQDDAFSMKMLERVYREGLGVEPDPEKADAWRARRESLVVDYEIVETSAPNYPRRALKKGIQGWVEFEFDITPLGDVEGIRVVGAEPIGVFEEAGAAAMSRFRYRPRMVGGNPVITEGVTHKITFELVSNPDPGAKHSGYGDGLPRYFPPDPPRQKPAPSCSAPAC